MCVCTKKQPALDSNLSQDCACLRAIVRERVILDTIRFTAATDRQEVPVLDLNSKYEAVPDPFQAAGQRFGRNREFLRSAIRFGR